MATCAGCSTEFDVDEFDVDRGDELSCPVCGASLEVVGLAPIALETAAEADEADEGAGAIEMGAGNGAFGGGPGGDGDEFD